MDKKTENLIRKVWNRFQQVEMMQWIGIHVIRSQRAELSFDYSKLLGE